ncbi:Guanine nucleotide-binding protein 1 [Phytophthora nicotianae]|uniref:Guanine nucleotide-binding protein 1 n=1 Tax=Phytophthora nicotianae TaxID=4792 RepID=A0A0W8DQT8_PHYNI|nr:Guanine nucleotide-binding protein 1 [Phytophthora nicotianae]
MYSTIVELKIVALTNNSATTIARAYVELLELSVISMILPQVSIPMANTVFEIQGTFKFASELAKCSFHCESGGHKTVQIGAIAFSTGTIAQCKLSTPLPVGFCHVTLSQNGVRVSRNSFQILVHSPVLISRVTPSTSTTVGGTLVTIEGSGFPANIQPLCHFGNLNIVKATAVSSNRLTCTTPAMRMPNNTAIVDMWITFGGIESLIQPFKFSARFPSLQQIHHLVLRTGEHE